MTNTGPTTMPGNLGVSPGIGVPPHFTGFPPGVVGPQARYMTLMRTRQRLRLTTLLPSVLSTRVAMSHTPAFTVTIWLEQTSCLVSTVRMPLPYREHSPSVGQASGYLSQRALSLRQALLMLWVATPVTYGGGWSAPRLSVQTLR